MSDTLMLKVGTALSMAALTALGVLIMEAAPAKAQEFDCRKASHAAERTICGHEKLSALDEKMSGLYSDVMDTADGRRQRTDIRTYQRQFLDARDSCRHDADCIKGAYLDLERRNRRSER